jgi:fatty acid desaturase
MVTKYYERSNVRGFLAIALDWLIVVSSTSLSLGLPLAKVTHALVYFLAVLVIASRQRGLENLVHEAGHNNLFATRPWNNKLQFIFAWPVFRNVPDYRISHLPHHTHLGDAERDPDIQRYLRVKLDELGRNYVWTMLVRPFIGFHHIEYLGTTFVDYWRTPTARIPKHTFWVGVFLLFAVTKSLYLLLLYWLVPFFLVLPILRWFAESAKHSSLDLTDEIGSSRNNVGLIHKLFLHPHNDGFHEIHHLLPTIPWYNLPRAWKELMKDSYFREHVVASNGFRMTHSQMKNGRMTLKG